IIPAKHNDGSHMNRRKRAVISQRKPGQVGDFPAQCFRHAAIASPINPVARNTVVSKNARAFHGTVWGRLLTFDLSGQGDGQ
ncbi:MAG: hypothetical protein WAK23_10380, partial [Terriglobales bacterium]